MNQTAAGLYATFDTSEGEFVCRLFPEQAPKTVENFVGLANGSKGPGGKRFFDGLIFHRVIPNFMIQGGCPEGTGRGGPGYKFADEFGKERVFDRPGKLAMANAGPNTNGSQFFICLEDQPGLPPNYTIFGDTVSGMDVVRSIRVGDVMQTVTVD